MENKMTAGEAREKYFEKCIEIENWLSNIKLNELFYNYLAFKKNDVYDFKNKFMKYIKNQNIGQEEIKMENIKNAFDTLNTHFLSYFIESFFYHKWNNLFNHMNEKLHWTIGSSYSILKRKKIINNLKFEQSFLLNIVLKDDEIIFEKREEFKKINGSTFELFQNTRNFLAHQSSLSELTNEINDFLTGGEFEIFYEFIKKIYDKRSSYHPRRNPKYSDL